MSAPPQYQDYPKVLRHPNAQPAVISDDNAGGKWHDAPPGRPAQFPPVTVYNADDEAYHIARGYESPSSDKSAFDRAHAAPTPPGYRYQEYPRIGSDGQVILDPDRTPPPDNFYPLWVRMEGYDETLVHDAAEHAALLEERGVPATEEETEEPPSATAPSAASPYPAWVHMDGYPATLVHDENAHQELLRARGKTVEAPAPNPVEAECTAAIGAAAAAHETASDTPQWAGQAPRQIGDIAEDLAGNQWILLESGLEPVNPSAEVAPRRRVSRQPRAKRARKARA